MRSETFQLNTYNNPPNSDLLRQYGYVDRVSLKDYFRNWDWGGLEERLLGNPLDVVDIPGALVLEVVLERLSFSEKGETANGDYSLNLTERIDWWLEEGGDELSSFQNLCDNTTAYTCSAFSY